MAIRDLKENHTEFYFSFDENIIRLRSFYYISKPVFDRLKKEQKSWMDFQKQTGLTRIARERKDGKDVIHILDNEVVELIDKARESHLRDLTEFEPFLLSQIFIFSKSLFDFYIKDLIRNIYLENKDILEKTDKKLTYERIFSFTSLDELYEYVIDRECEKVGYLSYEELCEYLTKKLCLNLFNVEDLKDDMIEICELRNILVHNKGIMNEKFIKKVRKDRYSQGQKIEIDRDLMIRSINMIHEVVTRLDSIAKCTFFKE